MKKILILLLALFLPLFIIAFVVFQKISALPSPPTNFLILGLDPRNDQLEKTETTDTIIFAHLSETTFHTQLFSLPRDLWFYPDSVKINQIYPDSLKSTDSFNYLRSRFQVLLGQPVDKIVVITTADLKNLVTLVGGVDLYLDSGFTDTEYPNPDYIANPTPSIPLYKTVTFPSGWNHLTAENITEFVRSRKSADSAALGGTDLGRIKRQQLLLENLFQKIISQKYNLRILYQLFTYFKTSIKNDFANSDILSLGLKALPHLNDFRLEKIDLPTGEDPKIDLIFHPQKFINRQWVFITATADFKSLHDFINKSLLY
jgi:anionic cell wall polymer biosynthesis LytR-Cps2A-Psr (LCP) family protein